MTEVTRSCPICFSAERKLIKRVQMIVPNDFILPVEYDLVSCGECGLVYSNIQDTGAYDLYYESYTGTNTTEYSVSEDQKKLNKETVHFLKETSRITDNILDIGCSYGITLTELQNSGYNNLYAMDLDIAAINYLNNKGIDSRVGSIFSEVGEYNQKFDIIILRHILEHLFEPRNAINNIKNWLKPSGKIIIESPNLDLYFRANTFPGSFVEYEHINHFSLTALMNLMNEFELIAYEASSEIYPTLRTIFSMRENCKGRKIIFEENDHLAMLSSLNDINLVGKKIINKIEALRNKEIALWGVSTYVYRLLTHTHLKNSNIQFMVDRDPNKWGQILMNMQIQSPDCLKGFKGVIVVSGKTSLENIKNDIRQRGFKNEIVCLSE